MRGRPVCGMCMCPYGDDGDCACKKEGTTMTTQDTMRLALEWIEDAVVVLSRTSSAIQGGIGAEAEGVGGCSVSVVKALKAALSQQGEQRGSAGGLGNFDRAMSVSDAVLNPFQGAPAARPDTWTDDGGWEFSIEK